MNAEIDGAEVVVDGQTAQLPLDCGQVSHGALGYDSLATMAGWGAAAAPTTIVPRALVSAERLT